MRVMVRTAVITLRTLSCRCLLSPLTSFKAFQEANNVLRNLYRQKDNISTMSDMSPHQLVWIKCEETSRNIQNCRHCNGLFATESEFEIHLSKSHSDVAYIKCEARPEDKDEVISHSDTCLDKGGCENDWSHDVAVNVSSCSVERTPKREGKARRHCKKFLQSEENNFLCKICGRTFTRKYDLKRHSKCHSPPRTDTVQETERAVENDECDECLKSEWVEDDVKTDYEVMSGDESTKECKKKRAGSSTFHCTECGKNFSLKDSYFRHMRIHTGEKPFTCHVCGKQFRDSGGLARHLKDVHARIKKFSCDICGRSFASKATTEDHRRIHTGERPYICDSCGKAFKSKASLYIHSKIHTNLFPHKCSSCEKHFRRRQELLAHVTTHTGEKPHACEVCGKCFRVRGELLRHKLIHSEDKPYVCTECGLTFRQKRYLKNHVKIRHARREMSTEFVP